MFIGVKIMRDYKSKTGGKEDGKKERKKDECGTCVLWN